MTDLPIFHDWFWIGIGIGACIAFACNTIAQRRAEKRAQEKPHE
jgi:hypothetical protein